MDGWSGWDGWMDGCLHRQTEGCMNVIDSGTGMWVHGKEDKAGKSEICQDSRMSTQERRGRSVCS